MKSVLLLTKGLGRGGAERLVVGAVRHGGRDRFRYEVAYLLPWKDAFVPELRAMDVAVHCLGGSPRVAWPARLRALVGRRGIDLIHSHAPYPAVGARLSVGSRVRHVYTEHNVWERYHRATRLGNRLTFPRNDHVFAVSEEVARSVRLPRGGRVRHFPPVEVLYHGPDPAAIGAASGADGRVPDGVRAEFGIPETAPLVGTVANLKAHKGLHFLLEAALEVRGELPEARFLIVGQGPLEGDLKRQAKELGLDGTVIFAGYREDAPRVLSAFDLFVLSSVHEGLPISLVEAMALGKPPVVTRVGGHPEVVEDGESGLLVPASEPAALARGIVTVLRDGALRERLGRAARRRAARFDIREAVARIERVYGELLG